MLKNVATLALIFAGVEWFPICTQAQTLETKIASCKVLHLAGQGITAVKVFQTNDAKKSIKVILTEQNQPHAFPADDYQFSSDGQRLKVRVASFTLMNILRGMGTAGRIGTLGSPPSDMICNARW